MATLNEIAYNILNIIKKGEAVNAELPSIEHIKFLIRYYRSLLIKRDFDTGFKDPTPFEQEMILTMEMEDPMYKGYSEEALELLGTMFNSSENLPKRIAFNRMNAITYVSTPNGKRIPHYNVHRVQWKKFDRHTSSSPYTYMDGDTLILINESSIIPTLVIRGIFENPLDLNTDADVDSGDIEYPMPNDFVQRVVQSILSTEFKLFFERPWDNIQND